MLIKHQFVKNCATEATILSSKSNFFFLVLISTLMHSETSCYFVCVERVSHLVVCNFYKSFRLNNEKSVDRVRLANFIKPKAEKHKILFLVTKSG